MICIFPFLLRRLSIGESQKTSCRRIPLMNNTPNTSIRCTVSNCANHCQDQNYCALDTVQIGTHETNPTQDKCVDCQSFRLK